MVGPCASRTTADVFPKYKRANNTLQIHPALWPRSELSLINSKEVNKIPEHSLSPGETQQELYLPAVGSHGSNR